MDIATLDETDAIRADELFALHEALHIADTPDGPPPLREPFLASLRDGQPETQAEYLSARADGQLVGAAGLALPAMDNRHAAGLAVWVHPRHRRRGAGRALVGEAIRRSRHHDRATVLSHAVSSAPGGPPRPDGPDQFLVAMGFTPALLSLRRRIDMSTIDREAEQSLLEQCLPHATEYDLAGWIGLTPDPLAPGVAHLANLLNTDAPTGDVEIEQTTMDAERLHANERCDLRQGKHLLGVAAVHRGSGDVAAVTRVDVRQPGDHGDIWLTLAHPQHRGHRLGTIIKVEAHRRASELFPQIRYVSTGNADANTHMVAINTRLGYVAYETATIYQRQLA